MYKHCGEYIEIICHSKEHGIGEFRCSVCGKIWLLWDFEPEPEEWNKEQGANDGNDENVKKAI